MADLHDVPPGLVHGLADASTELKAIVAIFISISLFNSLELIVLVCWTFRQWRGLYFWALLISAIGLIPYGVGSIIHYFDTGAPFPLGLSISYVGFFMIIPMQSFVLYSRLDLVFYNQRFLKVLLDVIITVSVLLVIPNSVTLFGCAILREPSWNYAYGVVERLQVTGFCAQELFLSSLYMYSTVSLLKVSPEGKNRAKRMLYELLGISLIIIIIDIVLIVIEFLNLYYLQVCLKPAVYSIKLKLEFAVLGRLVAITKTRGLKQQGRVARSEFIGPPLPFSDFTTGATTDGSGGVSHITGQPVQPPLTRRVLGTAGEVSREEPAAPRLPEVAFEGR